MSTHDEFRRIHRATPLLRMWTLVVAFVAAVAFNINASSFAFIAGFLQSDHGGSAIALIPLLIGLAGLILFAGVVWGLTQIWWRATGFRLTDEEVQMKRGVIAKDLRTARFDRIQAVDLVESFIARVFRLAEVRIETAGGTDSAINIGFLKKHEAEALKRELLDASQHRPRTSAEGIAGVQVQAANEEDEADKHYLVPKISVQRSFASTLLSLTTVAAVLGAVFFLVTPIGLSASLPFFLGMMPAVWNLLDKSWHFNAVLDGEMLNVNYGLANRRKQSIPLRRIHAVTMRQPVLWRLTGWWTVSVTVVGYGAATDGGTSKILPVGSKKLALEVLEAVSPLNAAEIADKADPAKISHPRYTPPVEATWVTPVDRSRQGVTFVGEQPHAVIIHEGRLMPRMAVIDPSHIQELTLKRGMVQNILGLSSVVFNLVPGPVSMKAADLRAADAWQLLTELRARKLPALESVPRGEIGLD